jgi:hypothetical protein
MIETKANLILRLQRIRFGGQLEISVTRKDTTKIK